MIFEETLSRPLKRAIDEMGYTEATPIQQAAIPIIRRGSDLIGQAQTGTGKTAAFSIPALEKIDPLLHKPQAIILSPTRELAVQIANEVEKLSRYLSVRSMAIFGGQSIELQIRALRQGVQVIAGTPGRIKDHLNRGTLEAEHIRYVVMDEADEMLDMGFREDIESILAYLPERRQTLMFSATLPEEILSLAYRYMQNPEQVRIANTEETLPDIEQHYMVVPPASRSDIVGLLLEKLDPKLTLIFCNTRRHVDEVTDALLARGVRAAALHGEMRQTERDTVMARFRGGLLPVLVATDVAARGLDVEHVELVVNFDLPRQMENYVHRIGRTGRAGKSGKAVCFVTSRDYSYIQRLQQFTKVPMQRRPMPSLFELEQRRANVLIGQAVEAGAQGIPLRYEKWARQLLKAMSEQPTMAIAALMQLALKRQNADIDENLLERELPFEPERLRSARPNGRKQYNNSKSMAKGKRNGKRGPYEAPGNAMQKVDDREGHYKKTSAAKPKKSEYNEPSYYGAAARRKAQVARSKSSSRSDKRQTKGF